jgi:hypothetical protein
MVISGCSCSAPKPTPPTPDPLAGFHEVDIQHLYDNKAITDDYNDYLQKLPDKQKGYVGYKIFYENEAGQHVVNIQIFEGNKNASWNHVLFYDKDNKRIKSIRYNYNRYES